MTETFSNRINMQSQTFDVIRTFTMGFEKYSVKLSRLTKTVGDNKTETSDKRNESTHRDKTMASFQLILRLPYFCVFPFLSIKTSELIMM